MLAGHNLDLALMRQFIVAGLCLEIHRPPTRTFNATAGSNPLDPSSAFSIHPTLRVLRMAIHHTESSFHFLRFWALRLTELLFID